jgi:hypothetical protein
MQVVQNRVQYSAGLLCADSILLMSIDVAGTYDKNTLLAASNQPTNQRAN